MKSSLLVVQNDVTEREVGNGVVETEVGFYTIKITKRQKRMRKYVAPNSCLSDLQWNESIKNVQHMANL